MLLMRFRDASLEDGSDLLEYQNDGTLEQFAICLVSTDETPKTISGGAGSQRNWDSPNASRLSSPPPEMIKLRVVPEEGREAEK